MRIIEAPKLLIGEHSVTAQERFLATLGGDRTDRPFLWESVFLKEAVDRWHREGLPTDADAYEFLGFERAGHGGLDWGCVPELGERVVADDDQYEFIEDEAGGILRRARTEAPRGESIQTIQFPLRDRASWEIIKKRMDPRSPERRMCWQRFAQGKPGHPSPAGHSDGFSGSCVPEDGLPTLFSVLGPTYWFIIWAGFENAALMLYDQLPLVEEIYEHLTWFVTAQMESAFSQRVPDAVMLDEEATFKAGPFMSPATYHKLVCPKLGRIVDVCRKWAVPFVFLESGGNIASLLPLWKEIGINGIMPLDVSGGTDPIAVRRTHPDLALIGGIDRTVLTADPDGIRREVERTARMFYQHGRSMPSIDAHGAVGAEVSFDNIRHYADCLQREAARF
ncbi:MAG: uroporphyrinogen decarboxylase family protein [Candidatus Latescibacterota bacterium]